MITIYSVVRSVYTHIDTQKEYVYLYIYMSKNLYYYEMAFSLGQIVTFTINLSNYYYLSWCIY